MSFYLFIFYNIWNFACFLQTKYLFREHKKVFTGHIKVLGGLHVARGTDFVQACLRPCDRVIDCTIFPKSLNFYDREVSSVKKSLKFHLFLVHQFFLNLFFKSHFKHMTFISTLVNPFLYNVHIFLSYFPTNNQKIKCYFCFQTFSFKTCVFVNIIV
jgi:hypothetical protein